MSSQMDDDPIVPQPVDRPNDAPGAWQFPDQHRLPPHPRRRTGVIVGVPSEYSDDAAMRLEANLDEMFPGVTFLVVNGSTSVAFEWDADEQSHDLRAETDQIETTGPGDAYQTFVPGRTRYFVGDREITEAQLRSIGLHVQGPA